MIINLFNSISVIASLSPSLPSLMLAEEGRVALRKGSPLCFRVVVQT